MPQLVLQFRRNESVPQLSVGIHFLIWATQFGLLPYLLAILYLNIATIRYILHKCFIPIIYKYMLHTYFLDTIQLYLRQMMASEEL